MKEFRLGNGYSVSKSEFYDGYAGQAKWCIWKPTGELYMSCVSYKEAMEIATHLKNREDEQ